MMTDNEIVKAFECCCVEEPRPNCKECPIEGACANCDLDYEVFSLINRQKEEIERLEKEKESIKYCYEQAREYNNQLAESCETNCKKFNMTTRAEAIKEFAERLKENLTGIGRSTTYGNFEYGTVKSYEIDNLVKEMTGRLK